MAGTLTSARLANPQTERRLSPRRDCPERPTLRISVRPSFDACPAVALDVSANGACLICESVQPPEGRLALWWDYGPWWNWKIVPARVVYVAEMARRFW